MRPSGSRHRALPWPGQLQLACQLFFTDHTLTGNGVLRPIRPLLFRSKYYAGRVLPNGVNRALMNWRNLCYPLLLPNELGCAMRKLPGVGLDGVGGARRFRSGQEKACPTRQVGQAVKSDEQISLRLRGFPLLVYRACSQRLPGLCSPP